MAVRNYEITNWCGWVFEYPFASESDAAACSSALGGPQSAVMIIFTYRIDLRTSEFILSQSGGEAAHPKGLPCKDALSMHKLEYVG